MDRLFKKKPEEIRVPSDVNGCDQFHRWLKNQILSREARNDTISETLIVDTNSKYLECVDKFNYTNLISYNCQLCDGYGDDRLDDVRIIRSDNNITYYNSFPKDGSKYKKTFIY